MTSRSSPDPDPVLDRVVPPAAAWWLVAAVLPLGVVLPSGEAAGQAPDRVLIKQPRGPGQLTRSGTIVDYNALELVLRTGPVGKGQKQTIDARLVIEVRTRLLPEHQEGLRRLGRGEVVLASDSFERALRVESRRWVKRDIRAGLVRCALSTGDYLRAGSRFLELNRDTPRTRHFGLLPLAWSTSGRTPAGLGRQARSWRLRNSDVARLLSASHLLFDDAYGAEAINMLRSLRTSTDPRVQRLAIAQGWRSVVKGGEVTGVHLQTWHRHLRSLPDGQRGGPWYVLGRARFRRRQFEPAAAAFLWTSLVDNHDRHLAARATQHAADALLAIGRKAQARTLYRDLAERFPGTPAAREAGLQLDPRQPRRSNTR